MPAPKKTSYENIKEELDKLKRQQKHIARRVPVNRNNLALGYRWPSISMMLIAKKANVNVKTLYRMCESDERVDRLLKPFRKKEINKSNADKDKPAYGTKLWLEKQNETLKEKVAKMEAQKTDIQIKNLQINALNRDLEEAHKLLDDAKRKAKESHDLERENQRLLSENARLRKMLMNQNSKGS